METLPPCVLHHGVCPVDWKTAGTGSCGPTDLDPRAVWAQEQAGFQRYQFFLLVAITLRALQQMEGGNPQDEIPLEVRSELQLVGLNLGLNLPSVPALYKCELPRGGSPDATAFGTEHRPA